MPKSVVEPPTELSWDNVLAWRLNQQQLAARRPAHEALQVVSSLVGLHAQLIGSAELSLLARVDGLQPGFLDQALCTDRTLVKLWAMRGTLHLVPSGDYSRLQAALNCFDHYRKGAWYRYFGVDGGELNQILDAVGVALGEGPLTRDELAGEVGRLTGRPQLGEKLRESWGAMLKPASFQGKLCFGPNRGQNVTFVSPARWLGVTASPASEDALLHHLLKFLAAFGPATREEFASWWGVPPATVGRLLKQAGDAIASVSIEGSPASARREDVPALQAAHSGSVVRLLPAFDPYVIAASRHIEALLPGPLRSRVFRAQGWVSPVVVADGRIVAVWKHERKRKQVLVGIEPLAALTEPVKRGVEAEAARLAEYLGGTLEVAWLS